MRVPCTYLSFRAFPSAKKREHKPTVHMHLFIESLVVLSTHCAVLFSFSVCVYPVPTGQKKQTDVGHYFV